MVKKIYLIAIILIVLLGISFLIINISSNKGMNTSMPKPTTYVPPAIPSYSPSSISISPAISKIIISNVTVNNIYISAVRIDALGNVLIRDTVNYQIVYQPKFQSFTISILSSNFVEARKAAEQDLLNILNVSSVDACKLNVNIGTSYKINPDYAYKKMGLSFCEK